MPSLVPAGTLEFFLTVAAIFVAVVAFCHFALRPQRVRKAAE